MSAMARTITLSANPMFRSVMLESDAAEFDPNNIRSGNMTKEEQLQQLCRRINDLERRKDTCCKDFIFWEAYTQIVRMHTKSISSVANILQGGGIVVSSFDQNVNVGMGRKGSTYTVTFPVKWDDNLFTRRSVSALSNGYVYSTSNPTPNKNRIIVNYRIVEDNFISVANVQTTHDNYAKFWLQDGEQLTSNINNNTKGHRINPEGNWGTFVRDVQSDGTVVITDHRMNTNFNVIRYYTQWILRECADGSIIEDPA